jgi:hypothetical protein
MMKKITTGWTFTRAIFLILGGLMVAQAFFEKQWFGVAIGSYFAAMGLFSFGCAAGNCYGGNCTVDNEQKRNTDV